MSAAQPRAWIDGAARGNPGDAGFGVVLEDGDEAVEVAGFLGRTTNNVAEYVALLAALALARRRGLERLVLHSDSELIVRQLEGRYRVRAPHLAPLFLRVVQLRRHIPDLEIRHVSRQDNHRADRLANLAIDERRPVPEWLDAELPPR